VAVARTEQGQAASRRQTGVSAKTRKVTVTIPADTLEAAVAKVRAGHAPSLSAYVSRALAKQVASDDEPDAYLAFLDRLDEELGPPTPEEYEWARRFASQR
jgi:hypothetical protein